MGKNQKNLSIPKKVWEQLEKTIDANREPLRFWNVETVPDLIKYFIKVGMTNLQSTIEEFRIVHKKTMDKNRQP